MNTKSTQAPGVPPGVEVVSLGTPFGGWVQDITGKSGSHYNASVEGVQPTLIKPTTGQYAESDGMTLFSSEKFGHMAPAGLFGAISDGSTHINDLALNGSSTNFSPGTSIVVLKNGRLVWFTTSATSGHYDPFGGTLGQTTLSGGVAGTNHTSGSGGHNGSITSTGNNDMLVMYDLANPSIEYSLSSWEDNVDADVMMAITALGSLNETTTVLSGWLSSVSASSVAGVNSSPGPFTYPLRKGVPHKMCKGPDGNIYVLNGSYVEQVICNGALTNYLKTSAGFELPLGSGWTAQGIVPYKNYVAIIASSGGTGITRAETAVFLWNGQSSTVNGVTSVAAQFIYPIPDNVGQGIFFDGEILFSFTSGRNNTSKIFELTSKGFVQVFESGFISPTSSSLQGSVESYQKGIVIGGIKNSQGRMFRFYGGGFHDEGPITDGTNTASQVGMLKNLFIGTLFAGIKYGSTYAIFNNNVSGYQLNSAIRSVLFTQGLLGRREYPLGFKGSANRFMLYLSQWGTGAALYLSLFKDFTVANPGIVGTDLLNVLIDTNTAVANGLITGTNFFGGANYIHYAYPVGTTEIDISDISIQDLSSFYVIVTWAHLTTGSTAAIIRRFIAFVSPSQ